MRHGGPSHDALKFKMPLLDIQSRGRWLAFESCKRYAKGSMLLRQIGKLSDAVLQDARVISTKLPDEIVRSLLAGAEH